MPVEAITAARVLDEIVGQVRDIRDLGGGLFEVRIGLSVETVGDDPGQLVNMLFGNSSLHDDVILKDAILPEPLLQAFAGPGHGLAGLRARLKADGRALTCSALKPQGLPAKELAALAHDMALGRLDCIKDDHGLSNQRFSPFADRVQACAEAVARAAEKTGHPTRYVPSLTGSLDALRQQMEVARNAGIDTVMIAPMIAGLSNGLQLKREYPEMAVLAHPTLAGAARIAPPFLLGKLFRLVGADGVIFPNHGGRFSYSDQTCRAIARAALSPWRYGKQQIAPAIPVPAGGMSLERVPEMLRFYGMDVMLLIGGALLSAGARLTQATEAFTRAVAEYTYG